MGEILFGLIMTLTFTLAAGIVIEEESREGAREMLIGIMGCNLAWGIIDGVLYVLGQAFERGRIRRVGFHVRQTVSDDDASGLVAAQHTLARPCLAGPAFVLVGVLLGALAIPLGG